MYSKASSRWEGKDFNTDGLSALKSEFQLSEVSNLSLAWG